MNYPTADELIDAGYTPEPLYIGAAIARALDLHTPPLATERSQAHKPRKRQALGVGITRVKSHGRHYISARRKAAPDGKRPMKWFPDTDEGMEKARAWLEEAA